MNSFLLETIITFNLNRPFISLGKQPFYLIQELLNKPEFEEEHFSVAIQSMDPLCVLQKNSQNGMLTVAFSNDRIFLKLSYVDIPEQSKQFELALSSINKILLTLSDFLVLKWGVKGVSVFGNFMLLDVSRNMNAAKLIADGIMRVGYLSDPKGIELKYNLQQKARDKSWVFDDYIRIFKAKFDGSVAGKMNPENVGIQREIYFPIDPSKYTNLILSEFLDAVKSYFAESNIKGLINAGE